MSVDPSSLIFVVIVGIWAVYLLQHWVRRREQLATSRSIDRFSEAMRVLERRAPIPVALPTSQNRPYVVASVAAPAHRGQGARSSPEVAMKQAPMSRVDRPAAAGGQAGRPAGQRAQRPIRPTSAPRRTHRLRGLSLLTLLVATPACWAAHIWGTLLLWPTLLVTGLLVVDLLLVRAAVRRAAVRRRMAARRAAGVTVRRSPSVRSAARPKAFPAQVARSVRAGRAPDTTAAGPAVAAKPASATTGESSAAAEDSERMRYSHEAITEVIVLEGGWEPVAVPPPTYTMKPKADRPGAGPTPRAADSDSAPARTAEPPAVPAGPVTSAIEIDELDLDTVLERRRAAGE